MHVRMNLVTMGAVQTCRELSTSALVKLASLGAIARIVSVSCQKQHIPQNCYDIHLETEILFIPRALRQDVIASLSSFFTNILV